MEKRPEIRVSADIPVRVWGMDADGKPFFQSATAGSLSSDGAQLAHINHSLKKGDIIGIQYGDKKARFEVVWVKPALVPERSDVGVMVLPKQEVPWGVVTAANATAGTEGTSRIGKTNIYPSQGAVPDSDQFSRRAAGAYAVQFD